MAPPLATWKTKRPVRLGVGVGVDGCGLGAVVTSGTAVGMLCVGVLVGTGVSVAVGTGVAEMVEVGVSWGLVGKGMMVGSGATSCPHADSRTVATTRHSTHLAAAALFIPCFLFIA
jgi:hypothetical protein